jgi:hypothetical protein
VSRQDHMLLMFPTSGLCASSKSTEGRKLAEVQPEGSGGGGVLAVSKTLTERRESPESHPAAAEPHGDWCSVHVP